MVQQHLLSSLLRVDAFAFMQFYPGGAKQVVGGIALAMASTDLMIKPGLCGV
jgi:hypothetical protein